MPTMKNLVPSESLLVKSFNSRKKKRESDGKGNHFAIKRSLKFSNASTHCKATGKDREKIYCIAWMMLQKPLVILFNCPFNALLVDR